MKKINFRAPRYFIPVILLPFLFILNFALGGMLTDKSENDLDGEYKLVDSDGMNTKLQDAELQGSGIDDKLTSYEDALRYDSEYTAIREIEADEEDIMVYSGNYTNEEIKRMDSARQAETRKKELELKQQLALERSRQNERRYSGGSYSNNYNSSDSYVRSSNQSSVRTQKSQAQLEREAFIEQMRIIDSISYPEKYSTQEENEELLSQRLEDGFQLASAYDNRLNPEASASAGTSQISQSAGATSEPKTVNGNVTKFYNKNTSHFNTIHANKSQRNIKAIIDEGISVLLGSRVRIRLLDDIFIDDHFFQKGSYLYAVVSGFEAERILLTVNSVLIEDAIVPVEIEIYDRDGMKGLYIPHSQFRMIAKEIGSNVAQGSGQSINIEDSPQTKSEIIFKSINEAYKSATKAVQNIIQKNKAKLKYNTIVYLISTND